MTHSPSRDHSVGFALSLTPAILWGALAVAIAGLGHAVDGVTLTWYRFGFAWLAQTAFLVASHQQRGLLTYRGKELFLIALVAGGLVTNFVAFACSLRYLPASTAQTLGQLQPALLLLGGAWLFRERLTAFQWAGALVLAIGLIVFLADRVQPLGPADSGLALGLALVLLATLVWTIAALAQKALPAVPTMHVLWYVYLAGAVFLAPAARPAELLDLGGLDSALFVFCCLNTLVAYGAFMLAVRRWEAARVSAVIALAPVVTYLVEGLVNRIDPGWIPAESWTVMKIVGACCVVAGAVTTALGRAAGGARRTGTQRK